MKNFKDFINDATDAVSYGYQACLLDYWALWASTFSFKVAKKMLLGWKELFTDYTLVELPFELTKLVIATVVFLSLPLTFWLWGTVSSFTIPSSAIKRKNNRERAMRDL